VSRCPYWKSRCIVRKSAVREGSVTANPQIRKSTPSLPHSLTIPSANTQYCTSLSDCCSVVLVHSRTESEEERRGGTCVAKHESECVLSRLIRDLIVIIQLESE
jgi:hypothetical protein